MLVHTLSHSHHHTWRMMGRGDWRCGVCARLRAHGSSASPHTVRTQHAGSAHNISPPTHFGARCRVIAVACRLQHIIVLADWRSSQAAIAQLGERQTEDLKVPGSILGLGRDLRKQSGAGDGSCPLCAPHSRMRSQPALGARLEAGRYGTCQHWELASSSRDSSVGRASD